MKKSLYVLIIFLFAAVCIADTRAIKYPDSIDSLAENNPYTLSVALVTGVYDYAGGWPDLPGVKTDLDKVSELLSTKGFKVERADNLTSLEFKAKFNRFLSQYSQEPRARLLVYYAGHGHTLTENGDKKGYIVLADAAAPSEDRAGFKSGSIPMSFFSDNAKDINAPSVLFMFDSCFSGTVFSMMRSMSELIAEMLKKPTRQFISSGTENQMVPDVSVFRRRFVYGLNGEADLNSDSIITGSELGEYLQSSVTAYTAGTQTPVYGKLTGFDGEFLFFNEKSASADAEKKPELPEKFADEKDKLIAIIKKNPHSPDAEKAMARLREIDDSLKNEPPVTAPERKDFVMNAKSVRRIPFHSDRYPFMVIAPLHVPSMGSGYKAAIRIKAKNRKSFRKLNERKNMLKSVMSRRLEESNLQLVSDVFEIRPRIKDAAEKAVDWVCPGCTDGKPAIAGLMGL